MRRLPCDRCAEGATGGKNREPLFCSFISPTGYQYKCSTCRTTHRITPTQFLAIPFLTPAQLAWEAANGSLRSHPQFAAMVVSHYMD